MEDMEVESQKSRKFFLMNHNTTLKCKINKVN